MKKRKILFGILALSLAVCITTGCGKESTKNETKVATKKQEVKEKSKGNCKILDCINKISVENTVEEINEIIGFEGELTDEKYNKYYWKFSENEGVEVTYYSGKTGNIKTDIDRDSLKNKKVDLSKSSDLKARINDGLTYEDFKKELGNVDGILIEKSSFSNKYIWVNDNGGYLNANFSNSTNKCTSMFGMVK